MTTGMPQAPHSTGGSQARTPTKENPGMFKVGGIRDPMKNRWIKALFYGPAGTGKTTLAGSSVDVPAMNDVLLISSEGGDMVLEDNDRVELADNIDEIRVTRIEQLSKIYEMLQYHVQFRDTNNQEQLRKLQCLIFGIQDSDIDRVRMWRTVIIDSLTEIEAMNLSKVLGLTTEGAAWDSGDDMPTAGFPEFRKNNNTIQAIVRAFRDLPINLIIICGQSYVQDELKKMHYGPWMTGKLSTQIQSFVDLVGYMVVSTADPNTPDLRRLYIQPQSGVKFDAKNRRAAFKGGWFDNPTMKTIMEAFKLI